MLSNAVCQHVCLSRQELLDRCLKSSQKGLQAQDAMHLECLQCDYVGSVDDNSIVDHFFANRHYSAIQSGTCRIYCLYCGDLKFIDVCRNAGSVRLQELRTFTPTIVKISNHVRNSIQVVNTDTVNFSENLDCHEINLSDQVIAHDDTVRITDEIDFLIDQHPDESSGDHDQGENTECG